MDVAGGLDPGDIDDLIELIGLGIRNMVMCDHGRRILIKTGGPCDRAARTRMVLHGASIGVLVQVCHEHAADLMADTTASLTVPA